MSELCLDPSETALAAATNPALSELSPRPPPGLFTANPSEHGDPARCNEVDQEHGRSGDGVIENVAHHPDESDRGKSPRPGDHRATCELTAHTA